MLLRFCVAVATLGVVVAQRHGGVVNVADQGLQCWNSDEVRGEIRGYGSKQKCSGECCIKVNFFKSLHSCTVLPHRRPHGHVDARDAAVLRPIDRLPSAQSVHQRRVLVRHALVQSDCDCHDVSRIRHSSSIRHTSLQNHDLKIVLADDDQQMFYDLCLRRR